VSIKEDAELQHVLGHLWLAIDHAARGEGNAALYELDSIEGLIFFNDSEDRVAYLERLNYGKAEPLQRSTTEENPEETGEA
jgi:hypothetical protein